MSKHLILALPLVTVLSACTPPASEAEAPPPQGREETRSIRSTEAVGYSGNAIADKVDGALDTNDQRMQQLKEAEAAQQ